MSWKSLFFVPANRPDLINKLDRVSADNIVVDLEDGTPMTEKKSARAALADSVGIIARKKIAGRLLVRINGRAMPFAEDDINAALVCGVDGILLPKIESADDLQWFDAHISAAPKTILVGGVESSAGVLDLREVTRRPSMLRAIYFGPEDLAADAGIHRSEDSLEVLYARQHVVLAAKAAGIAAIDQAVLNVHDIEAFARDCERGRDWGYDGKICLNPKQACTAMEMFRPTDAALDRARRLLATFAEAEAIGHGVTMFEGGMIDEPMVKRARALLSDDVGLYR